jgi:hypothetical protein
MSCFCESDVFVDTEASPAIERTWCIDGKLHREDGPAIEWADGTKSWYLNGDRHREDGPATPHGTDRNQWAGSVRKKK